MPRMGRFSKYRSGRYSKRRMGAKRLRRRFRRFKRRVARRAPLYRNVHALMPPVRFAKMTYRLNTGNTGLTNQLPAGSVWSYGITYPTKICANSAFSPNLNYNDAGAAPVSSHASAFEYYSMQYNCFEVVASKISVRWAQAMTPPSNNEYFFVGIKTSDDEMWAPTAVNPNVMLPQPVYTFNLPNESAIRYRRWVPNFDNNASARIVVRWSAKRQFLGARPVQNTVTRLAGGWHRPADQIWFIPFIARAYPSSTNIPAHLMEICVTYYVKWSDPRNMSQWNAANPNAQIDQAGPQNLGLHEQLDIVHDGEDEVIEAPAGFIPEPEEKILEEIEEIENDPLPTLPLAPEETTE
nr:MAG: putative capsid protein [Arizlama virus]